jgi:hypothetical protein
VPWSQISIVPCMGDCAVSTGIHALSSRARLHHDHPRSIASMDGGGPCAAGSLHDGDVLRALMCHRGGALDSTAGEPMGVCAYPYGLADRVVPGVKACEDPWPPADDEARGAVRERHDLLG